MRHGIARDWHRIFFLATCCGCLLLASCGGEQKKTASPPAQAIGPDTSPAVAAKGQGASQPQTAQAKEAKNKHKTEKKKPAPQIAAGKLPPSEPAPQVTPPKPQAVPAKPQDDPAAGAIAEAEKSVQAAQTGAKAGVTDTPVSKPADDLPEQKVDPAPIDETNQEVAPADANAKATLEAELKNVQSDLPLMVNEYVAGYINYFSTRGRGVFERALVRSGRYREMIERIFREEGVPQDLIYLAQAESGFYPRALSRAGARGMWQFIGARANGYGLERSWWVDDRQDPEKATRAAARHLKDLHEQFGDWYLAMAAYNSGPGNVQLAVKRTGYADFWELYKRNVLPKETKNYVPIILAMTIMSKNPSRYGLDSVTQDTPEDVDVVKVNYPVDLRLA
ncbi:MAG TPA: transglycosylase SLT domain-containing protein, partial [Alphaproteobacteria bacterium]|nr:transglycosylase SLT domain-containing protein [Alphaproteobacteria bacterium]